MEKTNGFAEKNNNKKTVIYDGACPMCTVFAGAIDSSTQKEKFALHDMTKGELPVGLTKAAVEKEIHVIDNQGKIYTGAEAILAILETYPRLRFLATAGRLPGIHAMLPPIYRFISTHRYTLFGSKAKKFLKYVPAICVCVAILVVVFFVVF